MSRPDLLDRIFGVLTRRVALFGEGWGDAEVLAAFDSPPFVAEPLPLRPSWGHATRRHGLQCVDGQFQSPVDRLPAECQRGTVRWFRAEAGRRAAVVLMAAAGDAGFWVRSRLFAPLAAERIDVFLLENPMYGRRRPRGQNGERIRTVADHAVMNYATIEEARGLVAWLREEGYGRVGLGGYSMGGFMAAAAAALTRGPVAAAVMAAGASPGATFTEGYLANSVDFRALGVAAGGEAGARRRLATLFDKTSLATFPVVARPDAAVLVACERDGFVPPEAVEALHAHWPGSELRRLNAGHVSAVFAERAALRAAVRDALGRL